MTDDDRLLENREIVLRGTIEDKLATEVIAKMLYLQHLDRRAPITLHIESPGGSVTGGLAILDTIDQIKLPVRTCCHRLAAAMATTIAAHGAKGHRLAGNESTLSLIAPYVAENAAVQPAAPQAEIDKINRVLTEFIAKDTGRTMEEVAETIHAGLYFSATQAKEFGLIDSIVRCQRLLAELETPAQAIVRRAELYHRGIICAGEVWSSILEAVGEANTNQALNQLTPEEQQSVRAIHLNSPESLRSLARRHRVPQADNLLRWCEES
jgi:ATP-dependent Clp protease protease subunit